MKLRELAEKFTRDYDFMIYKEDGSYNAKYERNEIVKLDYKVAEFEVISWAVNVELSCTVNVRLQFN